MIFQHTWQKVLSGEKTQTRRLVVQPKIEYQRDGDWLWEDTVYTARCVKGDVYGDARPKYATGHVYAVQPSRNKPAINWQPPRRLDVIPLRIRITNIRREDVRQISNADVLAEGFADRFEFFEVWCGMHDKPAFTKHTELTADSVYDISRTWDKRYREQYLCDWIEIALPQRPRERYDAWTLTFEVIKDTP